MVNVFQLRCVLVGLGGGVSGGRDKWKGLMGIGYITVRCRVPGNARGSPELHQRDTN